jgi:hypothetical protein
MNALADFFTLRPIFTFFGIRAIWYVYLLHMVIQIYVSYAEAFQLLAQRHISWLTWLPNSIPLMLEYAVQIVIVRLLFEVAATILLSPRQNETR